MVHQEYGKSTLVNRLLDEEKFKTGETKENDKGRHTTTYRQLIVLPDGGVVIDTPGMKEVRLAVEDLIKSFEDIELLAEQCKYRDCSHNTEEGCRIKKAIQDGELDEKRFENYLKLKKE